MNREFFYLDSESRGKYKSLEDLKNNDKRGYDLFMKRYKKNEWESKYSSPEEAYIENAPIFSTFGSICCISFAYIDNKGDRHISSFYGEDERKILEDFNNLMIKVSQKNFNLFGFRLLYFDIPWILHKLHLYGIKPADIFDIYDKKPWEMRIVDMAELWKQKFAYSNTFDEVAYELGIPSPKESMSGHDVHQFFWDGRLEEIKKYCESDVNCLIDCSEKLFSK